METPGHTPMDAAGHQGGESGHAVSSSARGHWDAANRLQRQALNAERSHGHNSDQAVSLREAAAAEREVALAEGFHFDGQGKHLPGFDRRSH